jgi:prepilin-type N-terminal cleavage/methylation domain-containing protein
MLKTGKGSGYSLIEVLVALTLLGLVMGAMGQIFLSQASEYKVEFRLVQRQQRLRAALEIMARDCRGAGYPALEESFWSDLTTWFPGAFIPKSPMNVQPKGIITVTAGGNQPDMLSLLTVISGETNPSRLSAPAMIGDTTLRLDMTSSQINDQFNVGDVIYLGKPSGTAVIKGISGQVLTIDTDPYQGGNQGLKKFYPAGTEIGEISLVSYAVFTDDNDPGARYHELGTPVLKRKINGGGFEPLGEDITDLKITFLNPELINLQLSVATGIMDNRIQAGQGKILTMTTQIRKRN